MKHLLSLEQLGGGQIRNLVDRSARFASESVNGAPLRGRIVGTYFHRTSTRTRTSFTVAALKLGAQTLAYGPQDLQTVTGESLEDTGKVLSGYLDALVVRTNGARKDMEALAAQGDMTVINAMSSDEHPTQTLADLSTLKEAFGRLTDLHILYLGEGNNTAAALALGCSQLRGMKVTFVTPEGFGLPRDLFGQAVETARRNGACLEAHHRMDNLPHDVDAVYTTRWQTMGVAKPDPDWRTRFRPYSVTPELMARVSRPSGTVFLHDLPAVRGEDVTDDVLNGPQSLAWRQAQHKLFSAMAVLHWSLE